MSHAPGDEFLDQFNLKLANMDVTVDPDLRRLTCPGCKRTGNMVMMTVNQQALAYCSSCDWSVTRKPEPDA